MDKTEDERELEETRPESPYQVFFVRTVPAHPIPWYTSGFQQVAASLSSQIWDSSVGEPGKSRE